MLASVFFAACVSTRSGLAGNFASFEPASNSCTRRNRSSSLFEQAASALVTASCLKPQPRYGRYNITQIHKKTIWVVAQDMIPRSYAVHDDLDEDQTALV